MQTVNTTNLQGVLNNLQSRVGSMGKKNSLHQPEVDSVVSTLVSADQKLSSILLEPDPGPRTDLDFTTLNNAVAALEQNGVSSQDDINRIARMIQLNTPA